MIAARPVARGTLIGMDESRRVYSTTDGDLRKPPAPKARERTAASTPNDGPVRVSRETSGRRGKTVTVGAASRPASSTQSRAISSVNAARAAPRRTAWSRSRATTARRSSPASSPRATASSWPAADLVQPRTTTSLSVPDSAPQTSPGRPRSWRTLASARSGTRVNFPVFGAKRQRPLRPKSVSQTMSLLST